MIGKEYLTRQASTLLRMARITRDPQRHAELVAKAAELKERLDDPPLADPPPPAPGHKQ